MAGRMYPLYDMRTHLNCHTHLSLLPIVIPDMRRSHWFVANSPRDIDLYSLENFDIFEVIEEATDMIKKFATWVILLIIVATCSASILTIGILQDASDTLWSINGRDVTITELEDMLAKIASFDTNQFLYLVTETNTPSSKLVQTIGLIQRAGLHSIGVVCAGVDGTNAGTWWVTLDARKKHLPTCTSSKGALSGFQRDNDFQLEYLPNEKQEKERQATDLSLTPEWRLAPRRKCGCNRSNGHDMLPAGNYTNRVYGDILFSEGSYSNDDVYGEEIYENGILKEMRILEDGVPVHIRTIKID